MRTAAGVGGLLTAIAAAGRPALAGAGLLLLVLVGALCWVLSSTARTNRLVRLITALRRRQSSSTAARRPPRSDPAR